MCCEEEKEEEEEEEEEEKGRGFKAAIGATAVPTVNTSWERS